MYMNVHNSFTARSKHLKNEENYHRDNFRKSQVAEQVSVSCTSDTQVSVWLGSRAGRLLTGAPSSCPEDLKVNYTCAGWKLLLMTADWAQKGVARASSDWEGKGFTEDVRFGAIPLQGMKEMQEEQVRWRLT